MPGNGPAFCARMASLMACTVAFAATGAQSYLVVGLAVVHRSLSAGVTGNNQLPLARARLNSVLPVSAVLLPSRVPLVVRVL